MIDIIIKVGNIVVIIGIYLFIGILFVVGMKVVFEVVNEVGGIDGRLIEYVNRDDGFDVNVGIINIGKLINEDKVFVLVGYFGIGIVVVIIFIIREVGILMVYVVIGVNNLYFEVSFLNLVMLV